ncbi:unnamed protein product [Rotaria sordida]|uniref:Interferon-induced transmembrane protein n=1 Tax=Rotaria sordida TaxID=392033 RepID=A0A814TB01_9BILA|nr:unnamed protein product [Rotaria sordida]CAF3885118.1 unnamed protein product [Rotaria sordida]
MNSSNLNTDSNLPPRYDMINPTVPTLENQPFPSNHIYGQQAIPMQGVPTQPISVLHNVFIITNPAINIKDYMGWSIFNLLFGVILFGLVGVLLSNKVRDRKRNGDIDGARNLSKWTAIWNTFSTLAGIGATIGIIIYVIDYNKTH